MKTYKREIATLCLLALFVLAFLSMLDAVALLVVPVFSFATVAFGMQSLAAQFDIGGKPNE